MDTSPIIQKNRINYKDQEKVLINANEIELTNVIETYSKNSIFYKGINILPNEIKTCWNKKIQRMQKIHIYILYSVHNATCYIM